MSQRHPPPGPATALVASLALGLLAAPASAADEAPGPGELDDLGQMSLEDLLNADVVTVTKSRQRASQTPAVVTVVTGDEIRARGYGSLAEVLRAVPGFYDVPDLVSHNIGIRGINGGPNASGNVVKLMIDGHPVDYRPTTGNFFGEELLPLEVVDRLEIIRGPASALYGANAFLGVVNVITRSGEALKGLRLIGHGTSVRDRIGGGGGVVIGMSEGRLDLLLGARILYQDRSGLDLPSSSPLLPNEGVAARGPSRNDTSRSGTLFGKLSVYNVLTGKLTFLASLQSLDAHGEFQSFGPLTHDSRIALLNQNYRLSHESARFNLSAHYFRGAPTGVARLNIGRPDYVLLPSVAAEGFGVAGESHFQPHDRLKLTFGTDFVSERHMVETFDQKLIAPVVQADGTVLHAAGTIIPGQNHGERRALSNVAAFAQSLLTLTDDWSGIVGLRGDHNSLYRRNFSARAGIVYAPSSISAKLLYGFELQGAQRTAALRPALRFRGAPGGGHRRAPNRSYLRAGGRREVARGAGRPLPQRVRQQDRQPGRVPPGGQLHRRPEHPEPVGRRRRAGQPSHDHPDPPLAHLGGCGPDRGP